MKLFTLANLVLVANCCGGSSHNARMAIGNPKVIGGQCNENEHWTECGSACGDSMCDGSHESGRCIQACVPRCECDEGMFRNDNGNCVGADEC